MASPAPNASRGHETGTGASGSTVNTPASTNKPAVDVTALTTRDDFLLELGEALGGQAAVRPVDSISAALDYLSSIKRGQLLVIDARDVPDVRTDVELVHAQAPHAVVLAFATAEAEKQVNAALKGSNVFAVLPVPIDKRKTSAVLDSAMHDAVARKATVRPGAHAGVTVESFQPRMDSGSAPPPEPEKSKAPVWIGLGIAAVAIAGGAYFFLNKGPAPHAGTAPSQPTVAAPVATGAKATEAEAALEPAPTADMSIIKGKVDELLEKARLAMRERRYMEPVGDNALVYYRSAAAADPTSGEAKDGLQRVATVAATRFEESMNNNKFEEASLALANFKVAAADDPRAGAFELKLFNAQLAKALADGNVDRAAALVRQAQGSPNIPADQLAKARADIARRQEDAKVQHLAALASDRIRDGHLTDAPPDDAKSYVQQLHDLAPSNPVTQRAVRELNAAYLRKAREASIAKNNADVDRWVAEARAGGMSAADINAFQRDLSSARQKAAQAEIDHLVQVTRERIRENRLTDPANDNATLYLSQLQSADPTNPQFAALSRELAGKLLDRARSSATAGKAAQVDADLTLAKHWGAEQKDILAIQQQAQASQAKAVSPSATRPGSGLSPTQLAAMLKRSKYTAPEYPAKALTQRISGSVTVEYVVDTNGDPRDVRVVEATPPGVFDKAATSAVKRWHYEPVVANGAPVEVPVRTAIRFELPAQ